MPEATVVDINDKLPEPENETRQKVRKGAYIGLFAFGALLLIDDAVKRFQTKKHVKIVAEDQPEA